MKNITSRITNQKAKGTVITLVLLLTLVFALIKFVLIKQLLTGDVGAVLAATAIGMITTYFLWHHVYTRENTKKKAATDFTENEILYRNMIENAGVVMYTTSMNGVITFASRKASLLTGFSLQEIVGMHFSGLIDKEWLPAVTEKYYAQVKNRIEETVFEFCIRTKNNELKWVEQSAVLVTENDMMTGFQCIVKDISEKKKMERVLRKYETELVQNQERLQSIFDNSSSLMYIKDLDGRYLLINEKFKETLNVDEFIVIGKTDFDFVDHVQAKRFFDTDKLVIATRKQQELEEIIVMPDGEHTILIIKFPLIDVNDKVYGISGIATDITERVRYQEQLIETTKIAEDAKKLQEQFLANMSHEIRTPMNGIQGMTDLLLETELTSEQKDFASTIKRSSDNLLVIINDILDFSKIQAGKLTIEKIDFKLTEVLANIKAIFGHRVKEKGLTFNIDLNEAIPERLNGDPHRLNQILVNLVGNAIKFTQSGGINIGVSIQRTTAGEIFLCFKITDTGIGIEGAKLCEVFESFTQGSVETARKYGGSGLGLAITKRLLELQRGTISVESEINCGTTFTFSLPFCYTQNYDALSFTGKDVKNYQSLFQKRNFLVVEDNEINQKVVKHVLKKAGGTVDIANNGLEAIALLNGNKNYDLIIMDLQMPEMDGYATTNHIRKVLNLSIPIIAMTASALKGEKSKCLDMGMNDYLSKPFDFIHLYKRISLLLGELPNDSKSENAATKKLFDFDLLGEMGDNEHTPELLRRFLLNTPKELRLLESACSCGEFETVYKVAHKLKGSAGLLNASSLIGVLNRTQEAASAKKKDELTNLCRQAFNEYKKLECELRNHLKNIPENLNINLSRTNQYK